MLAELPDKFGVCFDLEQNVMFFHLVEVIVEENKTHGIRGVL